MVFSVIIVGRVLYALKSILTMKAVAVEKYTYARLDKVRLTTSLL